MKTKIVRSATLKIRGGVTRTDTARKLERVH